MVVDMVDIESVRSQLKEELKELYSRSDRFDEHWRNSAKHKDWEELAIVRENDEVVSGLDEMTRQKIQQIEATLTRIDNEEYGICSRCGDQIEAARLAAMPTVTTCITCAAEIEKNQ